MIYDEIKSGESQNIEFKRELPEKSEKYIKTLAAFANSSGGRLIVGVDDKTREITGVASEKQAKIIDAITNALSDTVTPQIIPSITSAELGGKTIIIAEVFPGAARPYYITSMGMEAGTYVRVNATTRHADEVMLKELQLQGRKQSYDETVIPGKELNQKAVQHLCKIIKTYRDDAAKARGERVSRKEITVTNLENWQIVKREGNTLLPTIAFDLLTENTQRFAKIQCGLFKGNDRVVFIDKREFDGPIYEQIEEAYQFVLKHINLGATISGLYRQESYELPPEAIREAIANAVTHRNYMDNSCIQVCVYDNRVEITSPGMLYGGLTIEMIKNGRSHIRNAAIAEAFSRMYVIEGWGTGVRRMIEACRDYGVPEPVFTEIGSDFRVEFFRNGTVNATENATVNATENATVEMDDVLLERYPELQLMMDNPSITTTQIADILRKHRTTIQRRIAKLKEMNIVTRTGSDKSGAWVVKKQGEK